MVEVSEAISPSRWARVDFTEGGGSTKSHFQIPPGRKKEGKDIHPTRLLTPEGSADSVNPDSKP